MQQLNKQMKLPDPTSINKGWRPSECLGVQESITARGKTDVRVRDGNNFISF